MEKPILNFMVIEGVLSADYTYASTSSGVPVGNFAMSVEHHYRDRSGNDKVELIFTEVEVWKGLATECQELKKGDQVLVVGELAQDRWTTKGGEQRSKLKVKATHVIRKR